MKNWKDLDMINNNQRNDGKSDTNLPPIFNTKSSRLLSPWKHQTTHFNNNDSHFH